jgi:hypothetical protein
MAAALAWPAASWGSATFVGPVPYLSSADIPAGFYPAGSPAALEDFEDCSLDFGIVASRGFPIAPVAGGGCTFAGGDVDSVDADDGVIDGSGSDGRSWFASNAGSGVVFTFPSPVIAAGGVWTDGAGTTTFEAFGPGMVSLGTIGPVAIADASISGETAEDRFFGVQDPQGIIAIKLSNTLGGIEIDHIQYGGPPVPQVPLLPAYGAPLLALLLLLIGMAEQRRAAGASVRIG